jgi:thiol-disulfide isomerase/thioredoxin
LKLKALAKDSSKTLLMTAAAMVVAAMLVFSGPAWAEPVSATDAAPDFSAYTASGKKVKLSDFRGQTVMISFWGTWCASNKAEMDYFRELKNRHPDLVFLAVNSDTARPDRSSVASFSSALNEWKVPMEVIFDRDFKIRESYGIDSLPTGVIVNGKGQVAFVSNTFYSATPKGFEMMLEEYQVSSLK